uniref:Uncharacterized protein n=1 Tax=Aquisalinus luteolus TaxID=1566827 RepID=A0A8J3EVG0_9PROT|nr:hypothetical protein GCM10011355_28740 [Aquisalinus luteolus]
MGWRVFSYKIGITLFYQSHTATQAIILRIGNGGRVFLVIGNVVLRDFITEAGEFGSRFLGGQVLDRFFRVIGL